MIFLFLSIPSFSIYFDSYGVAYDSILQGVLQSGSHNLISYSVPNSVHTLYENCFKTSSELKSISFGEGSGLRVIQRYAFSRLKQLSNVDISKCTYLTQISDYAFEHTTSLTEIVFPSNLETIGSFCFSSSGLTQLRIPTKIKEIRNDMFLRCYGISTISFDINSKLEKINLDSFNGFCFLTSISIPGCVNDINAPFPNCHFLSSISINESERFTVFENSIYDKDMTELIQLNPNITGTVILPETVKSIKAYACHFSRITDITIPLSLCQLNPNCFLNSMIASINLSLNSLIKIIYERAFYRCTHLKKVILPSGCTSLKSGCFSYCSCLSYVFIPNTVTYFDGNVFAHSNLTCVYNFEIGSPLVIQNNLVLSNQNKTLLFAFENERYYYLIPSFVEIISSNAFCARGICKIEVEFEPGENFKKIEEGAFENAWIEEISIPKSCTIIETRAFYNSMLIKIDLSYVSDLLEVGCESFASCVKLTCIILSSKKINYGKGVFYQNKNLKNVTFNSWSTDENQIQNIAESMFKYCISLKYLTLPDSVRVIGVEAFSESGLNSINFQGNNSDLSIISFAAFKNSKIFHFVLPDSVNEIKEYAFSGSELAIFEICMKSKLTRIGEYAFEGCQLTTFKIPPMLKILDFYVFKGSKLKIVIMPEYSSLLYLNRSSFIEVENNLFFDTNSSNDFTFIQDTLYNLDKTDLIMYVGTKSVINIPNSVLNINAYSFYQIPQLEEVYFSDNVRTIGFSAFSGCSLLSHVSFGFNIQEIGTFAFLDCDRLTGCGSITYPPHIKSSLILAGIPEDALIPCPTAMFTSETSTLRPKAFLAAVLVLARGRLTRRRSARRHL